jgi:hypothetical protein
MHLISAPKALNPARCADPKWAFQRRKSQPVQSGPQPVGWLTSEFHVPQGYQGQNPCLDRRSSSKFDSIKNARKTKRVQDHTSNLTVAELVFNFGDFGNSANPELLLAKVASQTSIRYSANKGPRWHVLGPNVPKQPRVKASRLAEVRRHASIAHPRQ